jgi:hypothetical protein
MLYLEECLWKKEGECRYNMRKSLAILAERARKTYRKEWTGGTVNSVVQLSYAVVLV